MYQNFGVARKKYFELVIEGNKPWVNIVGAAERTVAIGQVEFFVAVQVVRRTDDGKHAGEVIFTQPDDFFLATYATMVDAVPAWAFANSETIFNDPCEVPGLYTQSPFSSKLRWHYCNLNR